MLRQSFLQRQIEALGGALARMLLGRDTLRLEFPAEALPSPERDLQARLLARLAAGDVCGAEDALFDAATQPPDAGWLAVALGFYDRLDGWTDEALLAAGFPREEILQGLQDVAAACGLTRL